MIKDLDTKKVRDFVGSSNQEGIENAINQIRKCPIIDGIHLKDVSVTNAFDNKIAHKLRRIPVGYLVTKMSLASTNILFLSADKDYLTLSSSAISTVDIWIF